LDLPGFGLELNPNAGLIDAARILNPAPVRSLKPVEEKEKQPESTEDGQIKSDA
jgi:hypothetical protein